MSARGEAGEVYRRNWVNDGVNAMVAKTLEYTRNRELREVDFKNCVAFIKSKFDATRVP